MPRRNRRHGDPYRGFTIRVKWDSATIPGVTSVGPLHRSAEVTEFREGGDAGAVHSLPGRTTWAPFVLRRLVSNNHAFEQWANLLSTQGQNLASFRKDVRLELYTAEGHLARAYTLHKCWVQAYEALSTLNVEARHSVMETLTLHYERWERDTSIPASP